MRSPPQLCDLGLHLGVYLAYISQVEGAPDSSYCVCQVSFYDNRLLGGAASANMSANGTASAVNGTGVISNPISNPSSNPISNPFSNRPDCVRCPIGTACSETGLTLATLRVRPGYYRERHA